MMENIIAYIFILINMSTCIFCYKILTKDKIKISKKKLLIAILILGMLTLCIRFLNNAYLNILSNLFLIFLYLKIIYSKRNRKILYYSIVISFISLLSDAFVSIIINNCYLENFMIFQTNYYIRSLLTLPVCGITLIFCKISIIRKIVNNVYLKFISKFKFTKTNRYFLILVVFFILISFGLNAYNQVNKFGHILIIIFIVFFILIFLFTLYLMYQEYQIEQVNKKIIEENNYIKNIAKQDEEFKHNLINNLLGIKTIANKKTNKLIEELINDYQQDYKNITNINDLPNGVQSIIYRKAYEENIEDLNLVVDNSIEKELYDILNPKKYNHLCTSVGILFDNALQAVKNDSNKIIEINFLEDNENIYVILKNSFSNFIDLEEVGKRSFTTKTKGHGIGVNYVSRLKTLEMKNEIINNMFVSKLIIKKAKKYS